MQCVVNTSLSSIPLFVGTVTNITVLSAPEEMCGSDEF